MTKDDKVYEEYEVDFEMRGGSRESLRNETILRFLKEKGGYWSSGKKHVTRYKYYVEKLGDGRRVYLYRPTYLNKGIDFQVWVEGFKGQDPWRPSHEGTIKDLMTKKQENPEQLGRLLEANDRVWNCEEPDQVLKDFNLTFGSGASPELLLKTLKWLYIEQDVTYWNYDGRGMLKDTINGRLRDTQSNPQQQSKLDSL